jgi:hypothetical protein
MSASCAGLGSVCTEVSATNNERPSSTMIDMPNMRRPGLGSITRVMSSKATPKLRVRPVTMASAWPQATMQAANTLRF